MKYKITATLLLALSLILLYSPQISAQAIVEDPVITIQTEWANHRIESFHFSSHGVYASINDGSLWRVSPDESDWISEKQDSLLDVPITIMPEAGTEHFPFRIIVHNKTSGWKDFTVGIESAPTHPGRALIADIDAEGEGIPSMTIQKKTPKGLIETTLMISPMDSETVQSWSIGQRIVLGGVWFPEYDPVGRQEYDCTFMYIIYNYDRNDFAFFAF